MNDPAAELRGIKSLNKPVEKGELTSMYLMIGSALFLHVLLDHLFIAVLSYGVRVVAACPELSSPEHFLHLCMRVEYLLGGEAFNDLHDHFRGHHGNTLDEEMHVVLVGSNLHEMNLVSFRNAHADLLQSIFHCFGKYLSSVFCRAYDMVKEERLVVSLEDMFTHPPILLHAVSHCDAHRKGIRAAELRGMF